MFSSKVVVVTGGNKGIGKWICQMLANEGANIVIVARDEYAAKETINKIKDATKVECMFIKTDVSKKREVENMMKEVIERFKKVDFLINNAAIVIDCPFLELSEEIWDITLNVNLKGYFLCSQAAAKEMVKQGIHGKIINITSVQGVRVWTQVFHAPYEISKAGIIMLTKQLAYELAHYNINVNAVGPGPTDTEILEPWTKNPEKLKSITKNIPLGRIAKPSDVAGAVKYLLSSEANYLTGITIFVDGGRLTW